MVDGLVVVMVGGWVNGDGGWVGEWVSGGEDAGLSRALRVVTRCVVLTHCVVLTRCVALTRCVVLRAPTSWMVRSLMVRSLPSSLALSTSVCFTRRSTSAWWLLTCDGEDKAGEYEGGGRAAAAMT